MLSSKTASMCLFKTLFVLSSTWLQQQIIAELQETVLVPQINQFLDWSQEAKRKTSLIHEQKTGKLFDSTSCKPFQPFCDSRWIQIRMIWSVRVKTRINYWWLVDQICSNFNNRSPPCLSRVRGHVQETWSIIIIMCGMKKKSETTIQDIGELKYH